MIIPRRFYEKDTIEVAKALLGQIIVRKTAEGTVKGIIVETEAYMGEIDAAAHSYKGRSDRVRVQYGPAGYAYIYLIYGMYHCLNITTGPQRKPEVVLIRALEPCLGLELMGKRRNTNKIKNLCSGPGKLCKAFDITKEQYGADLCSADSGLYLEYGNHAEDIEESKRINIDYSGDARDYLWRFTIKGNKFVSR